MAQQRILNLNAKEAWRVILGTGQFVHWTSCCIALYCSCPCDHCCTSASVLTRRGRYDSELDFTIDGVTYNVTHHAACGLTSAGYEDTECMAEVHAKYNGVADVSCWVDKRLLPECGAAGTTNTCVSYSAPEWDMGCWVCCLPACLRPRSCSHCPVLPVVCFSAHSHFILGFRLGLLLVE